MTELPVTRVSLLLRLRDPRDIEAWGGFVEVYGPFVSRLRRADPGLQDDAAADLTQEVSRAVQAQQSQGLVPRRYLGDTKGAKEDQDHLARLQRALGDNQPPVASDTRMIMEWDCTR